MMLQIRHKIWLGLLALIFGAAWTWQSRLPPGSAPPGLPALPRAGFPAPEFSLSTLRTEVISLDDLRGKVVILNLWTSWCPPCREEMPALQKIYEVYQDQGLEILAVNSTIQDSPQAAQAFSEQHGLTFPILLDSQGQVSALYQLQSLPSTFFIDQAGVVREVVIGGPMAEALLHIRVQQLLEARP